MTDLRFLLDSLKLFKALFVDSLKMPQHSQGLIGGLEDSLEDSQGSLKDSLRTPTRMSEGLPSVPLRFPKGFAKASRM